MGHMALARQDEALGQGVEHAPEFELTHHLLQISRDRISDNGFGGFGHHSPSWSCSESVRAPPSMTVIQSGLAGLGELVRYSRGSRANRPGASPAAARGGGASAFSVGFSRIGAHFGSATTSRSRARPQAVSTGAAL